MSKAAMLRFYGVAEYFNDDERVMAWAIVNLLEIEANPEDIYRDLLNCKYSRWIDYLEQIIDTVTLPKLNEYCLQKIFEFDMMNSNIWSVGDDIFLEWRAWKLGSDKGIE